MAANVIKYILPPSTKAGKRKSKGKKKRKTKRKVKFF